MTKATVITARILAVCIAYWSCLAVVGSVTDGISRGTDSLVPSENEGLTDALHNPDERLLPPSSILNGGLCIIFGLSVVVSRVTGSSDDSQEINKTFLS